MSTIAPTRTLIAPHHANPVVPIIGDDGHAVRPLCFSSAHRCNGSTVASGGDVALAANPRRYVLAVAALTLLHETVKPSGVEQSP
jgi:hypothetical protein